MRDKLTAKHPRPASPARAPVRPGLRKSPKTAAAAATGATGAATAARSAPATPRAKPAAHTGRSASVGTKPAARAAGASAARTAPRGDSAGPRGSKPAGAGPRAPRDDRDSRGSAGADKPRTPRPSSHSEPTRNTRGSEERGRPAGARIDTRTDKPRGPRPSGPRPSTPRDAPRAAASGERRPAPPRGERSDSAPRGASHQARPERAAGARDNERPRANTGARPSADAARPLGKRVKSDTPAPRKPAATGAPAHREVDETGMMRLSKRMSELGLCSRREADEWIEQGWVKVDGVKVDTLGAKVHAEQKIDIMPAARADQAKQVTILLHKPVGYVSGQPEDDHKPAAALINAANQWELDESGRRFHPFNLRALAPAGRLDIESTGLLVMTQDGRIAKQLIGEKTEIDKEYLVRVTYNGHATEVQSQFPAEQLERLRFGLELDDEPLKPAEVEWQNGEQLRFVLREGKKRQIRRMCELVGLEVIGLKRIRIGQVVLGNLPAGQWRYLLPGEAF